MTEIREDEYLDPADGLIHCRNCGGPRQPVIPDPFKGGSFKPRCVCPCQQEAERRQRAERNTEYALEQMFSIIDSRYRFNKPLIVTTNLKLDDWIMAIAVCFSSFFIYAHPPFPSSV